LAKYADVLAMAAKSAELAKELAFERAYALYKLSRLDEALDVINAAGANTPQLQHLQAQIVRCP